MSKDMRLTIAARINPRLTGQPTCGCQTTLVQTPFSTLPRGGGFSDVWHIRSMCGTRFMYSPARSTALEAPATIVAAYTRNKQPL